MEYLTAEELYNYEPEDSRMGGSSLGGAAKRLFTGRREQYESKDEEELNNRVNTFKRQQFLAGFTTPNKRRVTNIGMLKTRFLSTRKKCHKTNSQVPKELKIYSSHYLHLPNFFVILDRH